MDTSHAGLIVTIGNPMDGVSGALVSLDGCYMLLRGDSLQPGSQLLSDPGWPAVGVEHPRDSHMDSSSR